jgi:hypothetical protein
MLEKFSLTMKKEHWWKGESEDRKYALLSPLLS